MHIGSIGLGWDGEYLWGSSVAAPVVRTDGLDLVVEGGVHGLAREAHCRTRLPRRVDRVDHAETHHVLGAILPGAPATRTVPHFSGMVA